MVRTVQAVSWLNNNVICYSALNCQHERSKMKKIFKYLSTGIAVIAFLTLIVLRVVGVDPQDQRPGLWLAGKLSETPLNDWAFTDDHYEIYLQTNTPYFIPHSVTVYCATYDGELYLLSAYYTGGTFPDMRSWNRNIVRDPRVRLRIGGQLFDQTVNYVSDEMIRRPVYDALGEKYPNWERPTYENMHILAVGPADS